MLYNMVQSCNFHVCSHVLHNSSTLVFVLTQCKCYWYFQMLIYNMSVTLCWTLNIKALTAVKSSNIRYLNLQNFFSSKKPAKTSEILDMWEALTEELLLDQAAFVVDMVAVGIIALRIYVHILSVIYDFSYHRDDKGKEEYKYSEN